MITGCSLCLFFVDDGYDIDEHAHGECGETDEILRPGVPDQESFVLLVDVLGVLLAGQVVESSRTDVPDDDNLDRGSPVDDNLNIRDEHASKNAKNKVENCSPDVICSFHILISQLVIDFLDSFLLIELDCW